MAEQTIIMDGSNPKRENKERTRVVNNINFKNDLAEKQKKQVKKMSTLRSVAFMAGGAGLAAVSMGFMPSGGDIDPEEPILVPDEPQQATGVTDQMSYNEAWEVAREEVGAGGYFVWHNEQFSTYTQEEWTSLDKDDQQEFETNMHEDYKENEQIEHDTHNVAVVVHETAPVAEGVTDDMSFGDAFAMARQEVGPGGVFEWHGKLYGTYYKTEWDNMSDEDKNEFASSYSQTAPQQSVAQAEVEEVPEAEVVTNESEVFVKDEMITNENGQQMHVGYFKQGDEIIVKLDVNNDNQYDYIAVPETNQLVGLNGNEDVNLNQLASGGVGAEAVMSERMQIEGRDALVTLYSDGHQEAEVDIDGDGSYDTKLTLDTNGHMEMYDNSGNLIAEQEMGADNLEPVGGYEEIYADNDHDFIDEQIQNDEFGDDFDSHGDVSGWMHDDLV